MVSHVSEGEGLLLSKDVPMIRRVHLSTGQPCRAKLYTKDLKLLK